MKTSPHDLPLDDSATPVDLMTDREIAQEIAAKLLSARSFRSNTPRGTRLHIPRFRENGR